MAIGRITGPLLAKNLIRDGVDLAFETDLLYLDVTDGRIGIRKKNPSYELDVSGTINADFLKISRSIEVGKLVLSKGTLASSTGSITLAPANNDIQLLGNTKVTGDFYATGNIRTDGDIILGDTTSTDTVVFDAKIKSDIIPAEDKTFSLGQDGNAWLEAYIDNLVSNKISSQTGNISINPAAGLLEINGEIRASGRNPIGTAPVVTNVLYVTMDGSDTNDGRAQDPSRACRTITGAVRSPYYRPGTLIRVTSGRYLENNPILMQPNTAIVGDDLRTTSIEPINKTQDLFHVQSGCYIAQMQFLNGRSGLLPGPYPLDSNRGAYATAFPPLVNNAKIDVYHSPYIQNCTNQSGPWLIDSTLFVPNQTVQLPTGAGTCTFEANTTTLVVTVTTGTINVGDHINSGPQTPGFFNARTLLLANKDFIKDQVIAYVNQEYPDFVYEKSKWARDVGIIIENISYDATFGGNEKSVEAGLTYYDGVINLIEGQQVQATAAINYINTLSQYIIINESAPVISTATTQIKNLVLTDGVVASEEITAGINIITHIVNSGTSVAPTIFKSCGPETPSVSAEILLQANRKFFQEEVTAYVDAQYPNFVYKRDYCYRDVGLIVDAISQDILIGGNTKSIEAAQSYYIGGKGNSGVAEQAIVNNFTLLNDIILNGSSVAPDPVVGPNQGIGFSNANDILTKNRLFLQTEVSAYVRSLFDETFRLTQVQQNLWFQNFGLILDAIAEDTAAGGNANTVGAGLQYYDGFTEGQSLKTVTSLEYMRNLCRNIVKNIQNTNLYQVKVNQTIDLPAATIAEYVPIENNINLISDIITLGPDIIAEHTPISLTLTTSTNAINAFNILTANRNFLAEEVTGYIDDVFGGGFNYDPSKCSRDTGLIVDSLAFDLLYEGNTQAIFAGLQYYNQGSTVIPNEVSTTTAAINYIKELAGQVVLNTTVSNLQLIFPQVFDLGNPGDAPSVLTLTSLFNTVTNIISNGTVGITNQIIPNSDESGNTNVINTYNLLQSNKSFIQEEVITYIDNNNPSFVYNKTKCARDIGLIVDSLAQDLLFQGSSQSNFAGLQYWNQGNINIPGELTTATNAINHVRDLAIRIILNDTTGRRYQDTLTQYVNENSATLDESQIIYDEFNLIVDIIKNGTSGVTDLIESNSLNASSNINIGYAYDLLQGNKDYLIAETIGYIEAFKSHSFTYDVAQYITDLGYMIDSVSFDLRYGGNKQAIQSGVYYYGFDPGSSAVPNEQTQVSAAYEYLKTLCSYIVQGQRLPTQYQYNLSQIIVANTGTITEVNLIDNNIDLITNIISNGPSVAEAPSPIGLIASIDTNIINSSNILELNKDFIKSELIAYIDYLYPQGFVYDKTKCRRDIGYIIDCVSFDLLHTGNRQSIQAGVYYFGFNSTSSVLTYEVSQATAAYNHIKNISRDIIQGISVTTSTGNAISQVILPDVATDAEAILIANDIEIINDIINNGPAASYVQEPISLTASTDANIINAYSQLLANREFIKAEVIAFIDSTFKEPFVFDKITCTRDTKLIVDSVALDLIYEGSTQSEFAGLQYWAQGSILIPNEVSTITNAIAYTRDLVLGYFTTSSNEYSIIEQNFNTIIDIITTGTEGITDLIVPNGLPLLDIEINAAYSIILQNKDGIQDDVVNYVNVNNPGFIYDEAIFRRDVGYIIDSVDFDLLHGGNRQSIQAGAYYYGFNNASSNIPNEIPQVTAAYNRLKYLIKSVIQNQAITRSYQTVYPQILIPAYMDIESLIKGEETITVDAINYLKSISLNVINNTPVAVTRSQESQVINTFFENGYYASTAVSRNYDIITDVIANGPGVAPVSYMGSGFFATTGVSSDDVRQSPTVSSIISQVGNVYTIKISNLTLGPTYNGTLYFGNTLVFPLQDNEIPDTWASRRVDAIGAMGGSLVDGRVVSDRSPIQSFVYDAYTQLPQGGRGIHITNNGYAQLVSVFTIFCSVGVQVDNGGIASIVNSNSNFGDICLLAKGHGKREFSGTVYNPPFPTYLPNGEYYPFGYYPKNGLVEIYLPDTVNRPHISLVMEVEPPETYIDYTGNVVPYINQQGFPGFLNAQPSLATLNTGSIVIEGIDTTGIVVGNALYIRDRYGNQEFVSTGTVVVDVNYQSITINKGLTGGGGDPLNPDYFTLYFCGNSYYTVLSSEVTDSHKPFGTNLLSSTNVTTTGTDQISPELGSIALIKSTVDTLLTTASVSTSTIAFVNDKFDIITNIIGAADLAAAEAVIPATPVNQRIKKGTPPDNASLAIKTINDNLDLILEDVLDYLDTNFNSLYIDPRFNKEKCKRDVKLILRQINYDIEFGGNYYSAYTGLSYWVRSGTHHIVNLEEAVNNTALFPDGAIVNFYQRSYMSASGYVFEYVGAGTNYGALPQRGIKDPVQGKEVVQVDNGKVFFTSTDQNGDFRIGPGLVVSQATGVVYGRTFTKSLFANLTPFILAIEGAG